jgi:N-acetyltransferase
LQQNKKLGPCTLEGKTIQLRPLKEEHSQALLEAGKSFDWAWLSRGLSSLESVKSWISEALNAQEAGKEFPFVVIQRQNSNKIIGSTRYMDIREEARG